MRNQYDAAAEDREFAHLELAQSQQNKDKESKESNNEK